MVCEVCSRRFSRECDRKRHKCAAERQKPVSEQRGAAQCLQCLKWFRSRGGLALHRCVPESWEGCRETQAAMATVAGRDVVCEVCSRSFRREGDKKRHKCVTEREKPVSEQRGAAQCLRSGSRAEGDWLCINVYRLCQGASGKCTMCYLLPLRASVTV